MRTLTTLVRQAGDRLLGVMVPRTEARALDCYYVEYNGHTGPCRGERCTDWRGSWWRWHACSGGTGW